MPTMPGKLGQTALEYLLIVVVAISIVIVLFFFLTNMSGESTERSNETYDCIMCKMDKVYLSNHCSACEDNCDVSCYVDGVCGSADGHTYALGDPFPGAFALCSTGAEPATPPALNPGETATWTCGGIGGGSDSPTCSASREGPTCTDDDTDDWFVETSGCDGEPGFKGHGDCDDTNPSYNRTLTYYHDYDDDGYWNDSQTFCVPPSSAWKTSAEVTDSGDCNDSNASINPGATESASEGNCDDGLDNDCDGDIDCYDSECSSAPVCVGGPVPPACPETGCCCDSCDECNNLLSGGTCDTVYLNDDITSDGACISTFSSKTFDCQGKYSIESTSFGVGATLAGSGGTISGCEFKNFHTGINVNIGNGYTIFNNTVSSNNIGIKIDGNNNEVIDNEAYSNSGEGLYLTTGATNNQFIGNTAYSNHYGIRVESASDNTLNNNILEDNSAGIRLGDSSNNINLNNNEICANTVDVNNLGTGNSGDGNSCNTSSNWADEGVSDGCAYDCEGNARASCSCDSCESCETLLSGGSCATVYLADDIITDEGYTCIDMVSDKTLDCQGNTISQSGQLSTCIRASSISNSNIFNCNIENFRDAFRIKSSTGVTLDNNTARNNGQIGFHIWQGHGNTLTDNTAEGNALYGFGIQDSGGNLLSGNTAEENGDPGRSGTGLAFWDAGAKNNEIISNRFCDNNLDSPMDILSGMGTGPNTGSSNTCDHAGGGGPVWKDSDAPPGQPCAYSC